jgi:predicted nucleic acid-binding protein
VAAGRQEPAGSSTDKLIVIDACTWQNFAVVDALWVLEARYAGIASWTEAIRHELQRGVRVEPHLQRVLDLEAGWLGAPLRLDQEGDHEVDLIRRGLGGDRSAPLQHLGEAEAVRALERASVRQRLFVTDDGPAADFARRRPSNIQVLDAAGVLAEAYSMGDVGCPQAYDLLRAMWEYPPAPRAVRLPPYREVC